MVDRINGRYQLKEKIGSGGMGIVYLAQDYLTDKQVALKQIILPSNISPFRNQVSQPNISTSLQVLKDLKRALAHEFQIIASLRHPHIISVLDYGFDEIGNPFFTMPYLADAQTFLQAGRELDDRGKLGLISQLIQALVYLHRRDIIHRDLKPNNILVTPEGVKVLDFGLSASRFDTTNSSVGTSPYLAPEVWLEQPYTSLSDMFTLGVLAFQLFAQGDNDSSHPFAPVDAFFLDRVLESEPNWAMLACDERIITFLSQLLLKEPQNRPDAVHTLQVVNQLLDQTQIETDAIRESYLQAASFVGRDKEMAHLKKRLAQAKKGQGQAILIGGESGVGKSRLINELRVEALVNGFLVLRGQGILEGGLPYQLWREPVRRLCLLQDIDVGTASILLPMIPDLPILLDKPIHPAPELTGDLEKQRLFAVIADLFQKQSRPMVLLLEDLQWAEVSLDLLRWILRHGQTSSLLIVGTYRQDERPLLAQDLPQMSHMILDRLSEKEIEILCHNMLGAVNTTPETLAFLQQQSEGNTFFLVEIVRELAEQAGRLANIGDMRLPQTVFPTGIATILERRLSLTPTFAKPLLQLAALIGRQIDISLMKQLAGESIQIEKTWLPMLGEVGLLAVEGNQWQFTHDKLREGIINQLDSHTIQILHRKIALAIESVYAEDASQAARLTYHWGYAGATNKERDYALQAAQYAQEQTAYQEALEYLDRALHLTPESDIQQMYSILLELETIYNRLGDRKQQQITLIKLSNYAQKLTIVEQVKVATHRARHAYALGELQKMSEYAQFATEQTDTDIDPELLAQAHYLYGVALANQGKLVEARDKYQRAIRLFTEPIDPAKQTNVWIWLGIVHRQLGEYDHALFCLKEVERLVKIDTNLFTKATNMVGLGMLLSDVAYDLEKALYYHQQSLALFKQLRLTNQTTNALNMLGICYYQLGHYGQAIYHAKQCLTIAKQLEDKITISFCYNNMGMTYTRQQAYLQAETSFAEAIRLKKELDVDWSTGYTYVQWGHLKQQQGLWQEAERTYRDALTYLQRVAFTPNQLEAQAGLALTLLQQGQLEGAVALAETVSAYVLSHKLAGEWEKLRTLQTVYQVLVYVKHPDAPAILEKAYQLLQTLLQHLTLAEHRHSFLHHITEHQAIIEAYEA